MRMRRRPSLATNFVRLWHFAQGLHLWRYTRLTTFLLCLGAVCSVLRLVVLVLWKMLFMPCLSARYMTSYVMRTFGVCRPSPPHGDSPEVRSHTVPSLPPHSPLGMPTMHASWVGSSRVCCTPGNFMLHAWRDFRPSPTAPTTLYARALPAWTKWMGLTACLRRMQFARGSAQICLHRSSFVCLRLDACT